MPVARPTWSATIFFSGWTRFLPRIGKTSASSTATARDLARRDPPRDLARELPELALELPHARLARVARDDLGDRLVGQRELVRREAVLGELARDEVLPRDRELLVLGVAGELDDLEAVEERPRDALEEVRGRDEEDLGEVERDAEVVVRERVVLRRVEHLEERARRVALERHAELVDLVEEEDGVLRARPASGPGRCGPASRRRTCAGGRGCRPRRARRRARCARTCGPSRARWTSRSRSCRRREGRRRGGSGPCRRGVLLRRGLGAFGRRRRRGALGLRAQLADREELEDAVLHVAERVVVLVEDARRLVHVELVVAPRAPRQLGDVLEERPDDLRLHRLAADALEARPARGRPPCARPRGAGARRASSSAPRGPRRPCPRPRRAPSGSPGAARAGASRAGGRRSAPSPSTGCPPAPRGRRSAAGRGRGRGGGGPRRRASRGAAAARASGCRCSPRRGPRGGRARRPARGTARRPPRAGPSSSPSSAARSRASLWRAKKSGVLRVRGAISRGVDDDGLEHPVLLLDDAHRDAAPLPLEEKAHAAEAALDRARRSRSCRSCRGPRASRARRPRAARRRRRAASRLAASGRSMARSVPARPAEIGKLTPGKRTALRRGRTGRVSVSDMTPITTPKDAIPDMSRAQRRLMEDIFLE